MTEPRFEPVPHVAVIGAGMFGLTRLAHLPTLRKSVRVRANVSAALLVLPIISFTAGLWSMPLTHRLVFLVVYGWLAITSIGLLGGEESNPTESLSSTEEQLTAEPANQWNSAAEVCNGVTTQGQGIQSRVVDWINKWSVIQSWQ